MIPRKTKQSLEVREAIWNVKPVCACECAHVCVCRGKRRKTWVGAGSVSCHLPLEMYSPAPPPASPAPVCGTALVCSRLRHSSSNTAHCFSPNLTVSMFRVRDFITHPCFTLSGVSQVFERNSCHPKLWFHISALPLQLKSNFSFSGLTEFALQVWGLFEWWTWLFCFIVPPQCSTDECASLLSTPHNVFASMTLCLKGFLPLHIQI